MTTAAKSATHSDPSRIALLLNLLLAALSLSCLAGWILNIPLLSTWQPEGKPISLSGALLFLILGLLLAGTVRFPQSRPLGWLLGCGLIASLLLALENLLTHSRGMTVISLVQDTDSLSFLREYAALMSPLTAIGLIFAVTAIVAGTYAAKQQFAARLSEVAALFVFVWGSIGTLGYLYGTPLLYGSTVIPIALPSTIIFMLLGAALVFSLNKQSFTLRIMLGDTTHARLARAFMPSMIAVMVFAGWLNIRFQDLFAHINPAVLVATSSLGVIAASIVLISLMARRIGRDLDAARQNLVMANARELLEARMMQEKLSKSESCYRLLLDALPDTSVMLFDRDMRYMIVGGGENKKAGFDNAQIQGRTLQQAYPPALVETFEPLYRKALAGDSTQFEMNFAGMTFQQQIIPVRNETGAVFAGMVVAYNISEKKKAEEALQRTDKLDSLAILAGGIAHDFNNMLAGLFGYIEIARGRLNEDSPAMKSLNSAAGVFDRAKNLTQQLLTFSRGGAPERRTGALEPLLRKCTAFALSGSDVAVEYAIATDLSLCDFDENQMEQVIDNLVINAKQAMHGGGTIVVSAENIVLHEGQLSDLKAGSYIRLSVADSGTGTPDTARRIFDPFFTTKATGNGLGLSTCYSIVRNHEGSIEVESTPGFGATFHVYLPASARTAMQKEQVAHTTHRGSGRILVMDDEEFIREIIGEMLRGMGYSVALASNGDEAKDLCSIAKNKGETIVGAVLDLTVPGGHGGKWALDALREIFPDMPIIASSGYAEDPIMARPQEYGFNDCIRKPYRSADLAALMNRLFPGESFT